MKKLLGPLERLFPMPCPLVVGGDINEADTLAVAWINVVSSTPPTIVMGLRETRHTLELIRRNNTFTVNIAPTFLAAEVDFCGNTPGSRTDKFAACGLTLSASTKVAAPLIDQCPYNIECVVTEEVAVGAYRVLFGEVVEVHADESVLADPEGNVVDLAALDPLVYIAGAREYWRMGDKVADAYAAFKEIAAPE